ncbi:MAG: hypothetical protein MR541_00600 [Prevotella sp.]|nr:hypothetical protein [Prevotella sp.]
MKREEGRVKNPMEVKSEERGSDGSEGKCDNRVVANSTRRARFPISSSLKFFVLHSSLKFFPLPSSLKFFPLHQKSLQLSEDGAGGLIIIYIKISLQKY